jgi:predicted TIM-barrel fold metal-dependent hydrolase
MMSNPNHHAFKQLSNLSATLHPSQPLTSSMTNRDWVLELLVQMETVKQALCTMHEIPDVQVREQLAIAGLLR